MILKFLSELTESGYRIFSIDDAKEVASSLPIKMSYLPRILTSLIKQGMVRSLMRVTMLSRIIFFLEHLYTSMKLLCILQRMAPSAAGLQ